MDDLMFGLPWSSPAPTRTHAVILDGTQTPLVAAHSVTRWLTIVGVALLSGMVVRDAILTFAPLV